MDNRLLRQEMIQQARLLRRWLRRIRQGWRYGWAELRKAPVLFANSFPKSGTHLLTQVMAGFTRLGPAVNSGLPAIVTFQGDTGRERSEAEILRELQSLQPGDIAYGHLHALPGISAWLRQPGWVAYFILRDPRDVAVSHVHYITEMAPHHVLHRYYREQLPDFASRLTASIAGLNPENPQATPHLPDIGRRFAPYLGWLEQSEVLTLRYEEFLTDRSATLQKVLDHALRRGFPLRGDRSQAVETLAASIQPQRSPTFRRGQAGGWREAFSPEHKALFKAVAGDLLITLGYEDDSNW